MVFLLEQPSCQGRSVSSCVDLVGARELLTGSHEEVSRITQEHFFCPPTPPDDAILESGCGERPCSGCRRREVVVGEPRSPEVSTPFLSAPGPARPAAERGSAPCDSAPGKQPYVTARAGLCPGCLHPSMVAPDKTRPPCPALAGVEVYGVGRRRDARDLLSHWTCDSKHRHLSL